MTSLGDDVDMNCCKVCSPTFFKAGRAPSPESTSSSSCHNTGSETDIDIVFAAEVTVAEATRAKQFLVRMIPVAFWDLLHDRHTWHGDENAAIEARWQAAGEKSPINWFSRYGAIKVRQSMSRNLICWIDPQTHVAYFDAGNMHYGAAFDDLWPRCFMNISNPAVKGDLMGRFIGYGFIMEQEGHHRTRGLFQKSILIALDTYIYYTYVAGFF
jgi:hypothetical protein